MAELRTAPGLYPVVHAIVLREGLLALRTRLVRWLFILSLGTPLAFAGMLLFRKAVERMVGQPMDWDLLFTFLRIQCIPLALLALGQKRCISIAWLKSWLLDQEVLH